MGAVASSFAFALGIAAKMLCEVTNKALQRIARPVGERPKKTPRFGKNLTDRREFMHAVYPNLKFYRFNYHSCSTSVGKPIVNCLKL
jgi:hypothetical protein